MSIILLTKRVLSYIIGDSNDKGSDFVAQTNLNIRIDEDLKKQFEEFCANVGINMTTAFNMYAKKVVAEQKIPFEITAEPFYSEKNMKVLNGSNSGINTEK